MLDLRHAERIVIGLAGIVLIAATVVATVRVATGALAPGYTVTATFSATGQGLSDVSDVRIRGVEVGTVESVTLDVRGRAVVTMRLRPHVTVPRGTSAAIQPLSIFGPKFVSLDRSAAPAGAPALAAGASITDTTAPVELGDSVEELDRLLRAVDVTELATVVSTLSEGLSGVGEELGGVVAGSHTLAGELAGRRGQVDTLLSDGGRLAGRLADRGDDLVAIARDLNTVLPVIADRGPQLDRLLDDTAALSADLADVVAGHERDLDRLLRALERVSVPLRQRAPQLPAAVAALDGLFDLLGSVLNVEGAGGGLSAAVEGLLGGLQNPATGPGGGS